MSELKWLKPLIFLLMSGLWLHSTHPAAYGCEQGVLWAQFQDRMLCLVENRGDGRHSARSWTVLDVTRKQVLADLELPKPGCVLAVCGNTIEALSFETRGEDGRDRWILHQGMPLEALLRKERVWERRGELTAVGWSPSAHPLNEDHLLLFGMWGVPSMDGSSRTEWAILKRNPEGKYRPLRSGDYPGLPASYVETGDGVFASRFPSLSQTPKFELATQEHFILGSPYHGRFLVFGRTKRDLIHNFKVSDAVPEAQDLKSVCAAPVLAARAAPDGSVVFALRTDEALRASLDFMKNRVAVRTNSEAPLENFQALYPEIRWVRLSLAPFRLLDEDPPGAEGVTQHGERESPWRLCNMVPWLDGTVRYGVPNRETAVRQWIVPPSPKRTEGVPTQERRIMNSHLPS